jgi:DNA-directed RNA polymerase subunit beta'
MESFDYQDQFEIVKKDVKKAFSKTLDVQAAATGLQLRASDVWIDDNQDTADWKSQHEAVRKDRTWGVPVYASVELVDRKSGKVISTAKKVKIASLPKSTDLGSFIVNGKHYQVHNQLRRKPGIYVTEMKNKKLKTEINIAGRAFDVHFNPEKSTFRLMRGAADSTGVALYPILSRMGVSDSLLAKTWGDSILAANKAISAKKSTEAVVKAAKHFTSTDYEDADDAAKAMAEYFAEHELRPEVTKSTVGKEFKKLSPLAIVAGSKELLRAVNGERPPDDRQALEYKRVLGFSDIFRERFVKPDGELTSKLNEFRKKIHRKLNNQKAPPKRVQDLLGAGQFTPALTGFFTQSSLSSTPDQYNPINMLNGMSKITVMGEGGVSDASKVRAEERSVHPSHLGFIDPIHTPDSEKIGVVMTLPLGARKKGEDMQTEVFDTKTKKSRYVSPADVRGMVLAFPDQYEKGKFTSKRVKAIVDGQHQIVDAKTVDAVLSSPKQAFSIASNTIPFLASAQGVRAQMATKMLEQAIPLTKREAPLVQVRIGRTSIEKTVGSGFSINAIASGTIKSVSKDKIVIKTKDGEVEQAIYNNVPLNNKSFLHADARVKAGDEVKEGDLIADSNFTEGGALAVGTNMKVAYIPWKGYNFEDGVVITESGAAKLTSEHMHQYATKSDKTTTLSLAKRMAWKGDLTLDQQAKMDDGGVVRKGQILHKGDPIFVGTRENRLDPDYLIMKRLGGTFKPMKGYQETWSKDVQGEVVDVVRSGAGVKVYIKALEPAAIGDKITNRHGGKGIITKIIPDGEAPYTADGTPVDVLFNPHGVVSRINPSQILETAAAKIAEKNGKPFLVDNFSGANHVEEVNAALDKAKVKDVETLFDPHTKKPLGEVLVGPQYVLKLSKQATSQFSARSEGKYDINKSPLRGGEDGAKALDLITFYSMLAHGSRANLREMATYKATQNQPFWDWLSSGSSTGMVRPPPEPTFAYQKFEAYLKGTGVNVSRKGSKLVLQPMTDKEVGKLSNGEIKDPIFLRAKNLKEEKGGLMDPYITGGRLGGRWAHIQLPEPIANPMFKDPIKKLTGINQKQFMGLVRGELFVDPKTGEFAEEGVTGGTAFKAMLKKVDIDEQIKTWTDKAKTSKSETGLDEANKRLKYLNALKKLKVRPEEAYVQTKIAVLPPKFRPIAEMEDGKLSNPGINTLYRDLGLISNELKWQNSNLFIDDEIKAELRQKLFEGVEAVAGLGDPIAYYPEARRPKGIIQQLKGPPAKKGFFQYKVLRRQQNLVGRGTIIPEPKLGVDEVGLPAEMSWSIFEPFVMRRLVNQSGMSPTQASEEVKKRSPVALSMLQAEMSERPVILNRAPSLHKFGIMAFKPKMTDGKAIKIPPLVVKGFNADFDGDTMTVHVPILTDAVKEAEKMLPSNNLYNPSTGQVMIQPQNEAALGLYLLSKNKEGQKRLQAELPKNTKAKYAGVVLDKKGRAGLMKDWSEELPREHGNVVDKLKEMGDDHTYRTGFTVGMKDLTPHIEGKAAIFAKTRQAVESINTSTAAGRLKATDLVGLANKELDKAVAKSLAKTPNNFSLMVDSGARGNMNQLKQIVSAPFMVDDHKGNPNPSPIVNSFSEGLPFSSYWSTVYGARAAAVDKQLQTANPGAFNKDIMASAVTNVISEEDCGTTKGLSFSLLDKSGKFRPQDLEDRYLSKDVKIGDRIIARAGAPVTGALLNALRDKKIGKLDVRSPLTCKSPKGTCSKCFGLNEHGASPSIGDNVGAVSGQALSEPLTQMTMRTFHTGGISGTRGVVSGYEKIDKLFKMHKIERGKATLSEVNGKVEKVTSRAGGKDVVIGGKDHFIERDLWDSKLVRVGGKVKKGDIISKGLVQPKELVKLKGMLEAQDYVSGQIQEAYESQGVPVKRRAVETVIRSIGNTTKITDPGDSDFLYGEVAPWTVVEDYNEKSLGKIPTKDSLGHLLREAIGGLKIGEVITERSKTIIEKEGKSSVEVGPKPIRHKEFLAGIQRVPVLRNDWMAQMGYRDIADALVGGAATLSESDLHGYSPVPAFAYGAEFGVQPIGKKGTGVY